MQYCIANVIEYATKPNKQNRIRTKKAQHIHVYIITCPHHRFHHSSILRGFGCFETVQNDTLKRNNKKKSEELALLV